MNLYQRILGTPFVYDKLRPLVVGGLDLSPFYRRVHAKADSVLLDVGCGTGDALRYLEAFQSYLGVDTDSIAIESARRTHGARRSVTFECRTCTPADVEQLQPTEVTFCGVLHHLTDAEAEQLLRLAATSSRLRRVVTLDPAYLPGEPISNLLARLDRGRYCRKPEQYRALALKAGFDVVETSVERSNPRTGFAKYWVMTLQTPQ